MTHEHDTLLPYVTIEQFSLLFQFVFSPPVSRAQAAITLTQSDCPSLIYFYE